MIEKQPSATIRDVARRAGVSVATVSRVLNKTTHIAPDTEARVVAAISDLEYYPRAAARNLSNRKTNVIGLLLPGIQWDHFFPPLLRGVEAGCYAAGFELLIASNHTGEGGASHIPVGPHNTDGLLLFPGSMPVDEAFRLQQKGFPVVMLYTNGPGDRPPMPHVVFENRQGARQLVNHLIDVHGCRKIGMLAGPEDNDDSQWRLRGYREALAAHLIPYRTGWIRPGDFDEQVARTTMHRWLTAGLEVDAIFAADDDSAYGAIEAIHAAGRRVPEDIPVVGFDDSPLSRLMNPPLTTIRAPIEESGFRAAKMIAELIQNGQTQSEVLLPTELVVRRSCGCR